MTTNNSSQALHTSLLRPSILHILRAAGFQSTKPAVLDTVVDLAARYLTVLAEKAALYSSESGALNNASITHVRLAMEDIGVFVPRSTATEELWSKKEDIRGVQAFIDWCKGDGNSEIRRIAGMAAKEGAKVEVGGLGDGEDFLSALKKKTGKAGDESRYNGTILGSETEEKGVKIEGGPFTELSEWSNYIREAGKLPFMEIHSSSASALSSPPDDLNDTSDEESHSAIEDS